MTSNAPIIAWRNHFANPTYQVSHGGSRDNGTWRNALDGLTYTKWELEGQAGNVGGDTIQVTVSGFPAVTPPTFIGIANHNLQREGYTFRLRYWDEAAQGGSGQWQDVTGSPFSTASDVQGIRNETSGAVIDTAITDTRWEFIVDGTNASVDAYIGVLSFGTCLCLPQAAWSSASPIRWAYDVDVKPNLSASGHYLGRTIRRRGKKGNVTFRNIPDDWVRAPETRRFVEHALTRPFFLWLRPYDYPHEVEYVWATKPVRFANTGPGKLMSMSMELQAYAPDPPIWP